MLGIRDDLLHSWRVYSRTPFQSALAITTLGVAIAFATAFFSLYSDLALRTLPGVDDSRQLVALGLSEGDSFDLLTTGISDHIAEQATSLAAVEGYQLTQFELEAPEHPERVTAGGVTDAYFEKLGVRIRHGRPLEETDSDGHLAVISHDLALALFGAADAALNQELQFHDNSWRIIGVTEPGFDGLIRGRTQDLWISREMLLTQVWSVPEQFFHQLPMQAIGRLASGVSPAAAAVEVRNIAADLPSELHGRLRGQSIRVAPELSADPGAYRAARQQLQLMAGAAVLVALIAAGNLGLFLLARAPARQREMALRLSLGATRARLVRQLMTESSALVMLGTVLGVLLSLWLAVALRGLPLFDGGSFLAQGMDWRVPLFAFTLALLLAFAVGLVPSLGMARASLAEYSRGRRRSTGPRHMIATAQVLLAVIIVAGGLFAQHSLMAGLALDPGYDSEGLHAIELRPAADFATLHADAEEVAAFREEIRTRLTAAGNIKAIGFASTRPGGRNLVYHAIHTTEDLETQVPGIFSGWDRDVMEMMDIRLIHGRYPDADAPQEVLVNRHLAEVFWGRSDVIGEHVERDRRAWGGGSSNEADPHEIVGVVEDVHFGHPREPMRPMVLSGRDSPFIMADILVDGQVSREQAEAALDDFLNSYSVPLQVQAVNSLSDQRRELFAQDRSRALLTGLGAIIVLIMAVLGFYGTLRFLMDSHRFEFALNAALGAGPASLYRSAMSTGLVLALPGLLLGLPAATIVIALLSDYLGAVDALALPSVLVAVALLALALLLAIHPIARQAARRDPGPALRSD
ncbi:FtsX-like permease family protein [Natronospira bacteriovora]|uniref:ABC transporter permease n=1 Tax=Natronospira bacteriovora TaxID=3069753 RepID=A0ABU0W6Y0_9GAMM|nr:FtsX-like permease family protein [Natronospira sp. AB-CW4]MDQ2069766.1 ABC transporter permease [Natronospira sp. AB-CW4]